MPRRDLSGAEATPAPDAYGRPEKPILEHPQPRFSRASRDSPSAHNSHAGENSFGTPISYDAVRAKSPSYSLRSRTVPPHASGTDTLGPAAFNLQGNKLRTENPPAWTMRIRWKPSESAANSQIPGPGAYGDMPLPHLANLMARTAHLHLESGENVLKTNPQLTPAVEAALATIRLSSPERVPATSKASAASSRVGGGSPGSTQVLDKSANAADSSSGINNSGISVGSSSSSFQSPPPKAAPSHLPGGGEPVKG